MIDDIALFIHIVRQQGLSAAAARLNLPAATVTRRLQRLEQDLGCQLIHRSARKFSLTAEGETYYQAYADLVTQFETTERNLRKELHQLSGQLTVSAPTNASVGILQPMWSQFIKSNPEIQLTLNLSNENKDMLEAQVDIAMRVGPQQSPQLFQSRLGTVASVIVASPEYLETHKTPESVADLHDHYIISTRTFPAWSLTSEGPQKEESLRLQPNTVTDDIGMAKQLAVDGLGVTLLPVSEMEKELTDGSLLRILCEWRGPNRDIFAVWPTGRLLSARAKHLRIFMKNYIGNQPTLQGAIPKPQLPLTD